MGDCPSQECHQRVAGHHKTLYGDDGMSGVVEAVKRKADAECLQKYLKRPPTPVLITIIGLFVVPFCLTVVKVWSQQELNPHIYTRSTDSQVREQRIIALEKDAEFVRENITAIKGALHDQRLEMKEDCTEIKKMIEQLQRYEGKGR